MIQGIENTQNINFYSPIRNKTNSYAHEPLTSFDKEDQAIISAEAKLLNELDKYNSGESNEIELAITGITSKHQIEAELKVIDTKKEMLDTILDSF